MSRFDDWFYRIGMVIIISGAIVFSYFIIKMVIGHQPSEALRLEAAAVKFCNKLHHPVDLHFEDWKQCLKEFDNE